MDLKQEENENVVDVNKHKRQKKLQLTELVSQKCYGKKMKNGLILSRFNFLFEHLVSEELYGALTEAFSCSFPVKSVLLYRPWRISKTGEFSQLDMFLPRLSIPL